jgi:hypothetical protein
MNKLYFFVLLAFVLVSCLDEGEFHYKKTDFVHITELTIPDSVQVYDTIEITAFAKETNGCWKNLYFDFFALSDTSYSLAAYGTYESYGSCPYQIVAIDTLINIVPDTIAKHIIYVARDPYYVQIDTIHVKDTL